MNYMFYSCINLEYININNFNERKFLANIDMFLNILENVVICINENITKEKIFPQIESKHCYTIDCSNTWKEKQKKIINNTNECIESCDKSIQYKYEYNGKCYENCSNGYIYDENNIILNKCKCELDKCLLCPNVALNKNLCTQCNINYYPKENDPFSIGDYINCYNKSEEGYYLDKDIYKKCYLSCKKCNIGGNNLTHNCIECKDNFIFEIKTNNYFNCYENYTIKQDIEDIIKNILINNEGNQTEKTKDEEIKYYDNILKIIENEFTSENYDTFNLEHGQDDIIKTEKIITTLTTSENQKNNNMTRIDLGECETLLRNFYNISINETLYIKKIDIIMEGMKALKVEYDIYAKLFGKNLIKLNLTVCGQSKILVPIPIVLSGNLDIFNSSSKYYNDICYTTTSEDGTDILLKDRQKEFIDKDKIICQEDCDFSEYNYDTLEAKCSCQVKESSKSFVDMNINKNKLLENFKNINNIANFNILSCYKKLFNKNGISNI